jgi:SAM-dependent methyltransferase
MATERIKEKVRKEWTSPALVAAYRKWDREESAWGKEATDVIVQRAKLQPGMNVLDLACGHGEPSLAIAREVGPDGHVTATDLAAGLVAIAKAKANRMRLRNMTFRQADAHELPFPDSAFDRVTCKWGVTYFADCPAVLRESRRVLRLGGRATFVVWGTSRAAGRIPASEPSVPSPFTFSGPGSLTAVLKEAGFNDVEEEQVHISLVFPGSPKRCWEWFTDMSAPFEPPKGGLVHIESVEEQQRKLAIAPVRVAFEKSYDGKQVTLPAVIVVGSGAR